MGTGKSKPSGPAAAYAPRGPEVRQGADPGATETDTVCWQVQLLDWDHPDWGWLKLKRSPWINILQHLRTIEGLTWADLKAAAGGRAHGTNHHSVPVAKCNRAARDRLKDLNLDDCDELFSLRLSNKERLYGIRDRRALKLLWHDPFHGENAKAVYPVRK